jgi:hypothetical protein
MLTFDDCTILFINIKIIFLLLMKAVRFIIPLIFIVVFFLPAEEAYSYENGESLFDIGNFAVTNDWEIQGTYVPSGLKGCKISTYAENDRHIMDIIYNSNSIDVYLEVFSDSLFKTVIERGFLEREKLVKISFTGGPRILFTYENCSVEMHDSTLTFLKIKSTGKIVFSNLTGYTLSKFSKNIACATKGDFHSTIIGDNELVLEDEKIITNGGIVFRGITISPDEYPHFDKILTVENATNEGILAGEITVVKRGDEFDWVSTSYYNNVTIGLVDSETSSKKAKFVVSGDDHAPGKTIKLNVGAGVFSPQNLKVTFDGKKIPMAENIEDILDPNDDGLQPEYIIVKVSAKEEDEFFLLVSVPHFSTHTIVIESIAENNIFWGAAIASAFAVLAAASWVLFRK